VLRAMFSKTNTASSTCSTFGAIEIVAYSNNECENLASQKQLMIGDFNVLYSDIGFAYTEREITNV